MPKDPPVHYPEYDEKQQERGKYHPDDPLYAERFCICGGILRIRARADQIVEIVNDWHARHDRHPDPGARKLHRLTDKRTAWQAREAIGKAVAAQQGRAFKESVPPNLDVGAGR